MGDGRGQFRLEDVNPSPAFFDVEKLRAFNGDYIRALTLDEFVGAVPAVAARPSDAPWAPEDFDEAVFRGWRRWCRSGWPCWARSPAMVDFLFLAEPPEDEAAWAKAMKERRRRHPRRDRDRVRRRRVGGRRRSRTRWWPSASALGLKLGKTQAPVRVAVTGRTVGPPLFESLEVLGRERTLSRLRAAIARLAERDPHATPLR